MIATLRRRPLIAGLAVLAAALAVLLAFEIADATHSRIPSTASRPAVAAQAKLLPSMAAIPAEQAYPESVTRPLFTPTRRPAPAQAVAPVAAFVKGQFQLLGVIIVGNTKTAMLREKTSGKVHRVDVGREVNGIKVASIERDTVTLAQGAESEVLPMQVQKAGAVAAPPGVAGPFGQPAVPGQPAAHVPPPVAQAPPPPPPIQIPAASAALLGIAPPQTGAPANAPEVTTPMSPEELLARRRARRAQPNQ